MSEALKALIGFIIGIFFISLVTRPTGVAMNVVQSVIHEAPRSRC